MPKFPLPPGNPKPVPADLADLLQHHDYGLITANLMGSARYLLPRARLQRCWSLQERLRDAGFDTIRVPCALSETSGRPHQEPHLPASDTLYIPLDLRGRGTLHRTLVRLAREFNQDRIWAGRPSQFLRLIELEDDFPLASPCVEQPCITPDGHLHYRGDDLQCDHPVEWLTRPDNWIGHLACRTIAAKDWRELSVSREDCR